MMRNKILAILANFWAILFGKFSKISSNFTISFQQKALVSEPEVIPNDPDWEEQWAPVKIRAPEAWKITTGNRSIRVAIVSSGIDSSHPDLVDNMVPGYNSLNPGADTEDSNFIGQRWQVF